MAIVKETKQVFFNGLTITLEKGVEYSDNASLVLAKPTLFEGIKPKPKVKKAGTKKKVEEVKIEETFETPKEELLIEEPEQALKVEEITEETEIKEEPKRRKRK